MMEQKGDQGKLSSEFASRLADHDPQDKVNVIVLLQVDQTNSTAVQRPSREERQSIMQATRRSAENSLGDIEGIIKHHGGQILTDHPDYLGSVPVEITVTGIHELAKSRSVKAVIEDQSVYPTILYLGSAQ